MDTQATTFKTLTQKYIIKIPIIQRDYAQGRKNAQKIREKFVRDLLNALKSDKALHLQFIYGSVKNGNEFIPLDGQQRLTTLYLLHWYITMRNNTQESYLANFTYETRSSSREFCKALSENTQTMQDTLDKSNETILSETIKDQAWFLPFWEQDPTIQSMLTMLDSIHTEASKISGGIPKLETLDKLTFSLNELRDFGLDDELYIKMNARGAPLNDFENFKAAFEGFLGDKFGEEFKDKQEEISQKLDNEWLESVFYYVKNDKKQEDDMECIELAQSYMLNIIKYLCEMLYYKVNENEKSSFDWNKAHFNRVIAESNDNTTQNAHSMYKIFETQEALEILIYVFDNFDEIKDKVADIFISFTEIIGESVGDKVCIFDKDNEITSGKELFAAMVKHDDLSKKDAIYLFILIYLMKKQDSNLTNKLCEVRNYCNYEKQKYLSDGALSYRSVIQYDMGRHIKECVKICNDDIAAKDEIMRQFENHQYFKGDLELLFGKRKASGKTPLDDDDKAMLENAKIILNETPTHSIIANLIYRGFDGNFWLGTTYGKGKFLFGGKEAWHIMLTRNGKNTISGKLAEAFKAMFKNGLVSDDKLCKKFKPKQWRYYFIKYSESFFKDKHNVFTWRCGNNGLEIYRLVNYKSAEGKAKGEKPKRGTLNAFLEVLANKLEKAEYIKGENIKSDEHHVVIKGKCEIRCEKDSFVLTPLSDECKKLLEELLKQQPSSHFGKESFTISLNNADIIEKLLELLEEIFTKAAP